MSTFSREWLAWTFRVCLYKQVFQHIPYRSKYSVTEYFSHWPSSQTTSHSLWINIDPYLGLSLLPGKMNNWMYSLKYCTILLYNILHYYNSELPQSGELSAFWMNQHIMQTKKMRHEFFSSPVNLSHREHPRKLYVWFRKEETRQQGKGP